MMKRSIFGAVFSVLSLVAGSTGAMAETCGGRYVVQPGETLSGIADKFYKNAGLWTAIQTDNRALLGEDPDNVRSGMRLFLRCINGLPAGLERSTTKAGLQGAQDVPRPRLKPVTPEEIGNLGRIALLTGHGFAPFSDPELLNGGLITDVVNAAMEAARPPQGYAIHRVESWGDHLDPLLTHGLLDMGFPWTMPECERDTDATRCTAFRASDPMFEMLLMLFMRRDGSLDWSGGAMPQGTVLCRPEGFSVHQLDRPGRRWLSEGIVTVVRTRDVGSCFTKLAQGEVDGVVMNEFSGRSAVKALGLGDVVEEAAQPLSIDSLHVIVHRAHPDADALLGLVNAGLARIRENGVYEQILDAHMTRVWAEF